MRRFVFWGPFLGMVAVLVGVSMASHISSASALTNCDAPAAENSGIELQLLSILNAERAKTNAQPLKLSPGLNRAAAWKSHDSSAAGGGFSHTDSLGRDVNTRAQQCDYVRSMGENIAYGFPGAQAVFTAFMGSSGHKANMLNGTWAMVGIGEYQARWTLDFGTLDDRTTAVATPTATSTPSPTLAAATATPTRPPATLTPTPVPVTAAGVHLFLSAGFNLVTYAGPAQPIAQAVASLGTLLVAVYEWDNATERWSRYFSGVPSYVNTLGNLLPGHAYFVVMSEGELWSY